MPEVSSMTIGARTPVSADALAAVPDGQALAPAGTAARGHTLRTLSPGECFDLLEPGGVGRVAFVSEGGITIVPVNFAVTRKTIVFRTSPDSLLAVYANAPVSFESDSFDEVLREGWSVLIQGHSHKVKEEHEVRQIQEWTHIEPWAAGARDVYVRIAPTLITGRRVG
jgi:nitroimidazol reductase NimA-like FMN-containing flavoprotein (pyridoxamine 5'-phosphate oxidase superfamily)